MRKKLLIVDDDRSLLTFLTYTLEGCGHEVLAAEDGISALSILTTFQPDVIFVDLILPKIDGENLCRVIRSMRHLDQAFLVLLSGAMSELAVDLKAIGADACIGKTALPELARHVLAAVAESERPRPADGGVATVVGGDQLCPRRTTRELVGQKRHLEAILENLDVGVLEVFFGRVIYLNGVAAALIGRPKELILNVAPAELFAGEAVARVGRMVGSGLGAAAGPVQLELNGRPVVVSCRPLESEATTLLLIRELASPGSLA